MAITSFTTILIVCLLFFGPFFCIEGSAENSQDKEMQELASAEKEELVTHIAELSEEVSYDIISLEPVGHYH